MRRPSCVLLVALSLTLALFLAGCQGLLPSSSGYSTYPSSQPSAAPIQPEYSATEYLSMAAEATGQEKVDYQLLAATQYLQQQHTLAAARTLRQIDSDALTADQHVFAQALQGALALQQQNPSEAISKLYPQAEAIRGQSDLVQVVYYRSLAQAYADAGNPIASIQQRIELSRIFKNPQQQQQNEAQLWQLLQQLPLPTLQVTILNAPDQLTKGWYALATAYREHEHNPTALREALIQWQHEFGTQHPAAKFLPADLASEPLVDSAQAMTLLLPLSGSVGRSATQVRDGFMAAYYGAGQDGGAQVKVIDTTHVSPASLYQQAIDGGAQMVIGPLTKDAVQQVLQTGDAPVPVLTLNTVEGSSSPDNVYQFGLLPQDEAKQVAEKAHEAGYRQALVIVPAGSWGDSVAQTFESQWQQLGGSITATLAFGDQEELAPQIAEVLDVRQYDEDNLSATERTHLQRRRTDLDVVFLVADPTIARQIKPLLKFYYAGDLPVYATSNIYSGSPNARADKDLEGIFFTEMPWILGITPPNVRLSTEVKANRSSRLYAMGIDAHLLSQQLNQLLLMREFGIQGVTGTLTLDAQGHIHRKLLWAQFRNGVPAVVE